MPHSLSRVSTRGSGHSGAEHKRTSFFGAIKSLFSRSDTKSVSGAGTSSIRSRSQGRQRRLSVMSIGSNDKRSSLKELEERRSHCLAIRTAKNEPIEVQNLVVDCEFCNPPPQYGEPYVVETPQWTSADVVYVDKKDAEGLDEGVWNQGLNEWLRVRDEWLKKTAKATPPHHSLQGVSTDKYFVIYDKFVRHTRPLKEPMNLEDAVKLIKAGWVGEGTWPSHISPEDKWSDEDADPKVQPTLAVTEDVHGSADDQEAANGHNSAKVQFGLLPVPSAQSSRPSLKRIERTQSSMSNLTLARTHSNSSSLVSVTTDEEGHGT